MIIYILIKNYYIFFIELLKKAFRVLSFLSTNNLWYFFTQNRHYAQSTILINVTPLNTKFYHNNSIILCTICSKNITACIHIPILCFSNIADWNLHFHPSIGLQQSVHYASNCIKLIFSLLCVSHFELRHVCLHQFQRYQKSSSEIYLPDCLITRDCAQFLDWLHVNDVSF